MRILYGVVGEGMGHSTRSKVSIEWLLSQGHQVMVVVSGRAFKFLESSLCPRFKRYEESKENGPSVDVVEIQGLTMKYVDNRFDEAASVLQNVLRAPGMILENVGAYYEDVVRFKPEGVITDFDSFAYLFAKVHRLPILSIDNQQILHRAEIPEQIQELDRPAFLAVRAFAKAKVPGCTRYLITSFFFPKIREKYADDTFLIPPILRPVILAAQPTHTADAHFLVYQTSTSDTTLLPILSAWGEKCVVYGLGRSEQLGNITLKPFSEQGFVDDLASSRGVIANGGLSLLNEAVSLNKPVFSVPIQNTFEQLINAAYIKELGYGHYAESLNLDDLRYFRTHLASYASQVATFKHDSNQTLYRHLGEIVEMFDMHAIQREIKRPRLFR